MTATCTRCAGQWIAAPLDKAKLCPACVDQFRRIGEDLMALTSEQLHAAVAGLRLHNPDGFRRLRAALRGEQ